MNKALTEEVPGGLDIITVSPEPLHYGVVANGFLYNLQFSVRNNLNVPVRVKVKVEPVKNEENGIRLVHPLDRIAPGMHAHALLELTAEFPGSSMFIVSIAQSASKTVCVKTVEASVVSTETFKHVKKSLTLQKRPIYRPNVRIVGNVPTMESAVSLGGPSATFSETRILDEEDMEDLMNLPTASNVYWDPFTKSLRIDPRLGQVYVDPNMTTEEAAAKTAELREERLTELEEQGFLTINSFEAMKNENAEEMIDDSKSVMSSDSQTQITAASAEFSQSRIMSVTSLLAMKRDRIERQRKESVGSATKFARDSQDNKKIDPRRTLVMIETRNKKTIKPPSKNLLLPPGFSADDNDE